MTEHIKNFLDAVIETQDYCQTREEQEAEILKELKYLMNLGKNTGEISLEIFKMLDEEND